MSTRLSRQVLSDGDAAEVCRPITDKRCGGSGCRWLQWLYVHDAGALKENATLPAKTEKQRRQDTQYGASQRWRKAACRVSLRS